MSPNNNPLISIITVVKDDLAGFKRTANSIQLQKSRKFEWVIVDGSQSLDVCALIESVNFPDIDIKYFRQVPQGIYAAMNLGLRQSTGKFIWYLNAGDFLSTNEATRVVMRESSGLDWPLAFPVIHTMSEGHIYAVTIPAVVQVSSTERHAIMNHQGVLVPREILLEIGGFDETLRLAADGKLLDQIVATQKIKICSDFLVVFTHGGASSAFHKAVWVEIDSYRTRTISNYQISFRSFKSHARTKVFSLKKHRVIFRIVNRFLEIRSAKFMQKYGIAREDLNILFPRNNSFV